MIGSISGNNFTSQVQQGGNNQGEKPSTDQIAQKLASEHSAEELQSEYSSLSSGGGSVIGKSKGTGEGPSGASGPDDNTKLEAVQKALELKGSSSTGSSTESSSLSSDSQSSDTSDDTEQTSALSDNLNEVANQ